MDKAEIIWRIGRLIGDQADVLRCHFRRFPTPNRDRLCEFAFFEPPFRVAEHQPPVLEARWQDSLVREAENIVANRLSFFDREDQHLGEPIDWHRDWSAGITGPNRPCTYVDYREQRTFGDCKLVWEPNRHHQLVTLARAFAVTGSRHYAAKICELLESWLDANPFGRGMNWKSPLEIGIRLINWVWAIDLIRDSYRIDDSLWYRIQNAVHYSLWDLRRKFSKGSSANNHLIGEAAGAFVAASYFGHLSNYSALVDECQQILEHEIMSQTYEDGCTREHAFSYQAFVIQFFSICSLVARRLDSPLSDPFHERLQKMYEFLAEISQDTDAIPPCGDGDDGYVLDLGAKPQQIEALLSVGAQLLDTPTLQFAGASEPCAWLFGTSKYDGGEREQSTTSVQFPDSGYFVLRDAHGGSTGKPRVSVLFDCASLGYGSIAAHGHADCLSFTLAVRGTPVFVDSGTYDYFSYPEWREYFRSTKAHNTLEIDGRSQSTSSGPFMWSHKANPTLQEWEDDDHHTTVRGCHDGYETAEDPLVHSRRVDLDKTNGKLRVTDELRCRNVHRAVRRLHLAPGFIAREVDSASIHVSNGTVGVIVRHSTENPRIVRADEHEMCGWISAGYHRRSPSSCIEFSDSIDGTASLHLSIEQE